MSESIKGFLRKAALDMRGARHMVADDPEACADKICWDCQQAVEKWLKAALMSRDQNYTKTHDLLSLLAALSVIDPAWAQFRSDCAMLTPHLSLRYIGEADEDSAIDALRAAEAIGEFTATWIGPES